MIDADRLIEWAKDRKRLWQENRSADITNCWQRINEDACFIAAIEHMMEEREQ